MEIRWAFSLISGHFLFQFIILIVGFNALLIRFTVIYARTATLAISLVCLGQYANKCWQILLHYQCRG